MKSAMFKTLSVFIIISLLVPLFASCGETNTTEKSSDAANQSTAKEEEKAEIQLQLDKVPISVLLKQDKVTISGSVKNAETLTIADNEVTINDEGSFSHEVMLVEGENTIGIRARNEKDDLQEVVKEIKISRENPVITLTIPQSTTVTENSYRLSGSTVAGATVTLSKDGSVIATKTSDANGYFAFDVNTEKEGAYTYTVVASKEDYVEKSASMTVTRQLSAEEIAAAKRASATTIDFAHLSKNPSKYKGEYVKYTGQIVQILEEGNFTVIRLAITQTSYGWDFNEIIWVEYFGTTDFVDEDIVTVFGTIEGQHSYTSTAGWEITLPAMIADSVK